jgi:UDP-glucose 4-epimerase
MKKVLVTGAAGFIGSHVAAHCLRQGFHVVAIDDLSGGFVDNLPPGVEFHQIDVSAPGALRAIFEHGPYEYVYHLAAYAAEGLSHFIRRYNYVNNLVGSVELLNYAINHNVKCFIFTSSIAVYGRNQLPMVEDLVPQPEDPYGIAKYAFELDLKAAHEMFGMNYIIFRPHNVYGERQNIADKYRNVIGIFMNQVMHNMSMSVFGDGTQTRAFSYIDDVAPIIAKSPEVSAAYNQVFNIGADVPYTVLDLAQQVAAAFQVTPSIQHLEARNEVLHAFSDHSKLKGVFPSASSTALKEGIKRMAAWVKERGPMTPITFKNIEVSKKLPESWR